MTVAGQNGLLYLTIRNIEKRITANNLELIDQTWTPKTNNSDGYDRPIPSDEINSVRQKLNILAVELRRIVTLLD